MALYHRLTFCLAFVLSMPLFTVAQASAPQVKTQAPGYYRMMLGDFEVTALSDGTLVLPVSKMLGNTTPAKVENALKRSYLKDPVETSVNGFLINTGSKLVLIDTGAGTLLGSSFGPALGNLIANLKASGYQPEQVDEIYITHMHPDHVGGLMIGDKLAFPNATVRADQREADFWLSQAHMDAAPKEAKNSYQGAMASLNPYVAAGKFKPFVGDTELVPGIRAVASHGHTVGHTTYVVENKGQKLALWGDLMHVAAVQFADPSVVMKFDTDTKLAAMERKKVFADVARQGYWVAGAHIAFPGIGHLRADDGSYTWVPANYSSLRSEGSQAVSENFKQAVASPIRTDEDRIADAKRKPLEFLQFTNVQPGMRVLDIATGGGYTTQLLALAVGSNGTVWAQADKLRPTFEKRLTDHPQANIIQVIRPYEDPVPNDASNLDLITIIFNYHDIAYMPVDRIKLNQRLFNALKSGGHLVVIDHSAKVDMGTTVAKSLHRIDEAVVMNELRQAGFQLEQEGDFFRNASDTRDQVIFKMNIPVDNFALRFVKP